MIVARGLADMVGPFFMPIEGVLEMVSHLLPLGFSAGCHVLFKKSQEAFTARTRHPSGHLYIVGGTLPRPHAFFYRGSNVRT